MTAEDLPQVVFACVRNGGRSVIARVLTEHYAQGTVVALSAGTQPGERIHPEVADVLESLGLDTSGEHPKMLTRETIAASDVAITLGCGEECPYVPGVRYVDWPVDDPGGQDEATVRRIVADIDARVRALVVELVPGLELPTATGRADFVLDAASPATGGDGSGDHSGLGDGCGASHRPGHHGGLRDRVADDSDSSYACGSQWHVSLLPWQGLRRPRWRRGWPGSGSGRWRSADRRPGARPRRRVPPTGSRR